MKLITKLWATLLLLCVAGVANAATEYEVDQKFTSVAALDGQLFAIVNETDGKAIYNKDAQNLAYDTYANAIAGTAYLYKLHSLAEEADANVQNAYAIEVVKADGSSIGLWGNPAIYLNSGAAGGFDGCFVLGNKDQYGTDVKYGGAWEIEYDADKGFALKNVARGGYFAGVSPAPTGTDPIYWTFCTLKEKAQTDPLADQKDALSAAIAKGKMFNALAYTEASFGNLGAIVTRGEAALAAEDATAESLTAATTAINDAITALVLKDGYADLAADMFKAWDKCNAADVTSTGAAGCSYQLFVANGLPYGDASVGELNFADLSGYDKLIVVATEGTPRFMMNRDVKDGQWNETEAESHLIEYPKGDNVWSAKYFTKEETVFTVDLKQIVADKGFAHLNAIKGANWANVLVTGMYLFKASAAPAEDVLPIDIQFGEGFNDEKVSSYAKTWTATKDGKTWEIQNFNNNNNGWSSIKCGSKNDASVAIITSPVINAAVKNFVVSVAKASNFHSAKIDVIGSDGSINNIDITEKFVAGDVNVEVNGKAGSKYMLTIDNDQASANGSVEISKIALYGEGQYSAVHIANTAETAYDVAKAIELIDAGEALSETVFVKGIISKIDSVNAELGFITYWISADGSAEGQQFECYKGKTMEGVALADIEVGAEVIVTGKLKKYGQTYELDADNTIVAYKAPVKPSIANGTYYIKNVASGNYLTGANSWGTQASVAPAGTPFEVTFLSGGGYAFKNTLVTVANKYLGSNLYVDSTTPEGGFAIEKNEDGTYVIKLAGKYLAQGDTKGSTNDNVVVTVDELTDAAKWQILTLEEAVAALKASTNAGATFLISNPNFNRNTSTAAWTVSADCTNKNLGGGDNGNFCAESYHSPFTISQVLTNAPAGKYKMTAQGFFRQDDNVEEAAPVFFANDKTAQVPVKTGSENSMSNASNSFTAGQYTIEPIEFTVFEDGQLTIGVKNNGNAHQWVIWDNFQLTYLTSEIPADEFKPAYEDALAAAKAALADEAYVAVIGEEKTALAKAIEDYTTIAEPTVDLYKAAISALNAAASAFTAAKADYEAVPVAKAFVKSIDFSAYPYASEAKVAAALAAMNAADATSAADAKAKAQTAYNAARTAIESNALLEGTYGAINHSDSIASVNAETNSWTTGSIGTNQGQGYTDGTGTVCGKYLDGGWSGSAGVNIALTKKFALPAGKYILTTTARGSVDLTEYTMTIAGQTVNLPHIGAGGTDGVFGNGWNDAFVVFENTADSVTLEIIAKSEAYQNWISINRFRLAQFGVPGADAAELQAPEGWINLIANGNLAGDDVTSFVSKEAPSADILDAKIVEMAGKDNSHGIVVKSADNPAQAWDTQFWIKVSEPLVSGSKLHVEFDYKASKAAKASTQAHGEPGAYQHWAMIGDVNFTTEWQHFSKDIEIDDAMAKGDNGNGNGIGVISVAFNLAEEKTATEYYFDNFGLWYQKPVVPESWTDLIVNGNMEGESMECFYVTEQGVGGPFVAVATAGIGKDGGKAVKVQSADEPSQDWDTQFFIRLPYQLPAGTKYKVSFDYKADKAGDFDTQAHAEPGQYIHWAFCGGGSFTEEWQTYEKEGSVPAECDGSENKNADTGEVLFLKNFQSIAFNLAKNKVATEFIFDNVKFEVSSEVAKTLTPNPAVDPQPYPTGIETVKSVKADGQYYDLQGRRIAKPVRGLYILDGKKVVIK